MLRMQWDAFTAGDICLGDKGFCSYFDLSSLQGRGVDSVVTLCRRMPVAEAAAVRKLAENDLLIRWQKPIRQKASSYSKEGWEALPESMLLRQIRVEVKQPGFRVKSFHIITTLLDPVAYPANEIADLYFKRWDVELFFRDIKTTMGMDILRCKSPEMVRKEILMHFIVYNCIRSLMLKAVRHTTAKLRRISFKGAVQALRQWEPLINHVDNSSAKIRTLIQNLYIAIAQCLVPERPGRNEPRVVKRRPKPFALMTQKRHLYESK